MLGVAIVGGGLAGLSLAKHLLGSSREVAVFEAAERFGGRILSTHARDGFAHDLGPGWIWPVLQPRLARLVEEGEIRVFPQWLEGNALYQMDRSTEPQAYIDRETYADARRIEGGAYQLVEKLLQQIPSPLLHTGHRLLKVIDQGQHVELHFSTYGSEQQGTEQIVLARQVVLTVPPRLLVNTVTFVPELAPEFEALLNNTPTWMAGHAKAVVSYPHPFWREAGYSGAALARYQGAALAEVFDASSVDGEQAALGGFFALPATLREEYRDDLPALLQEQLVRLFGAEAAKPNEIMIRDWCTESLTATAADAQPPQTHPQYGHRWLQLDHWNDKLYFGGTESASDYGGYLEGALEAAERVARSLSL
jgi:monoamine oxidase